MGPNNPDHIMHPDLLPNKLDGCSNMVMQCTLKTPH